MVNPLMYGRFHRPKTSALREVKLFFFLPQQKNKNLNNGLPVNFLSRDNKLHQKGGGRIVKGFKFMRVG